MKRLVTGLILVTVLLLPGMGVSTSCSSADTTDLYGTAWHAVSINGTPVVEDSYVSLYLWSDGSLYGSGGINMYGSRWTTEGDQVNFHSDPNYGGITQVGGPENLMQQEEAYMRGFWSAATFRIDKNRLYLYDAEGSESVVFDRIPVYAENADDLENTAWRVETINGKKISDGSSARLAIFPGGIAYEQAGPTLKKQEFVTEQNLIRSAGSSGLRVGPFDEGGIAATGLQAFGTGTYRLKGDRLYVYSASGATATFRKFVSSYTFDPNPPKLMSASGSASWASVPDDMAEIFASSDLVVMGTGLGFIRMVKQSGTGPIAIYDWKTGFRIDAVFKGTRPDEIVLNQPVDQYPDGSFHYFLDCDPPVQQGERWILFLRKGEDDTYHEIGPWGRYKIVDEKVYSMNRVTGNNNDYYIKKLDIDGEDTLMFFRDIQLTLISGSLTFYDQRNQLQTFVFPVHTAGLSGALDARLSTGWAVSGNVTFSVRRLASEGSEVEIPMPEGMEIQMEPAELSVEPNREYSLVVKASTSRELPPAIYWMVIDAKINDTVIVSRDIVLSIHQP